MSWQSDNIAAAANYLRELIVRGGGDQRAKAVYEGLLDVLTPARRTARLQRELAESAKAAARRALQERRMRERRAGIDRRQDNPAHPGIERRSGRDRRTGRDRRSSS